MNIKIIHQLTNLILIVSIVSLASCKPKLDKNKLKVIEDIVLGGKTKAIHSQLDSLNIPHNTFFNVILFMRASDLEIPDNYISSYYTRMFNFSDFKNPKESIEHLGLITPVTLEGTENNLGLAVILGHTVNPWLFGETDKLKERIREKYFRQEVNDEVIKRVFDMYVSKYGEPKSIDTLFNSQFWMISGNSFSSEYDNGNQAISYKWESEYLTITFYTGFDLNGVYTIGNNNYVESTNRYRANIGDTRADPKKNQINCKAFPYIYYELNEKAIKELNVNNLKI